MHEAQLEELLRLTLRREVESLALTLTPEVLEQRLRARRREARMGRGWLVAAVAAMILAGLAIAFVGSKIQQPDQLPTPSPAAVLPESVDLLADFPDATLRLARSVGPAQQPVDPNASAAPGSSPAPTEAGRIKFAGPFVIGMACLGTGELLVEVMSPTLGFVYTRAAAPCDGTPVISQYLAMPIDPSSAGDVISVIVSPGASWRLAIGERPVSLITAPDFAPVGLTSGWNLVSNISATLLVDPTPATRAQITLPASATRAAVLVQCNGAGTLSLTIGPSPATDVACDAVGTTHRVEFPASGGTSLLVTATGDRPGLWVRMIVEANADIATTYPSAPPLPDDLVAVPYVAPDASVIGLGTLGSNRQIVLPIAGARPGQPAGDLLPVATTSEAEGTRLDLVSISSGRMLRTLASAPAPSFIFESWADATHDQVFYGIALETGFEFHVVSALGAGDTVVAIVPRDGQTGFTADLSEDDSMFVVDYCRTGGGCTRTIVNADTDVVRQVDRASDPICRILGIVDGLVVGTSREVCTGEAATALIAVPVDEAVSKVLIVDAPRQEIAGAVVVATPDGPKVVFVASITGDGLPTISVLDVTTAAVADLPPGTIGDPRLTPTRIRLPAGWLLLGAGALGDFPWQQALDRPAPVLVNLVTGERMELVNLPHWVGSYRG